jgi:putative peptidoglycan lipid II flippase
MSQHRPILSSAKRIALCTLASRITGLVRDVLLAQAFALSWVQDAFTYAFTLPNLFRRLFGEGGLAPVFVPTFTDTLEQRGRDAAWDLLARVFALLTVTLTALTLLIELVLLALWLWTPAADPEQYAARRLLYELTALMLPFMLTICILALFASILNCVGSFVPAALAPVLLNVAMIVGLVWLAPALAGNDPRRQVYVLAGCVLVAGVLQLLVLLPALRAAGVRLGWKLDWRHATVQRMLRLLPPVALGQGVLAFGVFLDAQLCILLTRPHDAPETATWLGWTFAYPLSEGALSALSYAQRLYQFPLGVLVISLATAALPAFSRYASRSEWQAWSGEVRNLLRLAVFEGLLTGMAMIVLAEPIVRLLFEYARFRPEHTTRTAAVLGWYGLAMWAFCAQHIVLRGFYSIGDVRTPLRISCAVLPLNILISLGLVWVGAVREAAFAIASAVTSGLAVVAGVTILQRRQQVRIVDREFALALARMLAAALLAGAVTYAAYPALHEWAGRMDGWPVVRRGIDTLGGLALAAGLFLAAAAALRLPETPVLIGRLWRRTRSQ